jgi:hypothetical protein
MERKIKKLRNVENRLKKSKRKEGRKGCGYKLGYIKN